MVHLLDLLAMRLELQVRKGLRVVTIWESILVTAPRLETITHPKPATVKVNHEVTVEEVLLLTANLTAMEVVNRVAMEEVAMLVAINMEAVIMPIKVAVTEVANLAAIAAVNLEAIVAVNQAITEEDRVMSQVAAMEITTATGDTAMITKDKVDIVKEVMEEAATVEVLAIKEVPMEEVVTTEVATKTEVMGQVAITEVLADIKEAVMEEVAMEAWRPEEGLTVIQLVEEEGNHLFNMFSAVKN